MRASSKLVFSLILSAVLFSSVSSVQPFAFADDDDKVKTLESECAKKLDKDKLNLDGLFCQIIITLQGLIDSLDERITFLEDEGVGTPGPKGDTGADGLSCWDLNGDGVGNDLDGAPGDEDVNNDNVVDILDCKGLQGDEGPKGDTGADADLSIPVDLAAGSTINGEAIGVGPHTTDTLQTLTCIANQVARSNGFGIWSCSDDDTLTEAEVDAFANNNGYSVGLHTTDTNSNAGTLCSPGQYLDGDGTCKALPTVVRAEEFIAPTLLNGFVNAGGSFSPAGYYMDNDGVVHLRGTVSGSGVVIFNLPEDYRPDKHVLFAVVVDGTSGSASVVTVASNGNIVPVGVPSMVSLDGISFRTPP